MIAWLSFPVDLFNVLIHPDGKTVPAFLASCFENITTTACLHSTAESVNP